MYYDKCPKTSNTLFNTILAYILLLMLLLFSGMANSVGPDQTAPSGAVWSGSALFVYAIRLKISVYEILGHLPYYIN